MMGRPRNATVTDWTISRLEIAYNETQRTAELSSVQPVRHVRTQSVIAA